MITNALCGECGRCWYVDEAWAHCLWMDDDAVLWHFKKAVLATAVIATACVGIPWLIPSGQRRKELQLTNIFGASELSICLVRRSQGMDLCFRSMHRATLSNNVETIQKCRKTCQLLVKPTSKQKPRFFSPRSSNSRESRKVP